MASAAEHCRQCGRRAKGAAGARRQRGRTAPVAAGTLRDESRWSAVAHGARLLHCRFEPVRGGSRRERCRIASMATAWRRPCGQITSIVAALVEVRPESVPFATHVAQASSLLGLAARLRYGGALMGRRSGVQTTIDILHSFVERRRWRQAELSLAPSLLQSRGRRRGTK